MIKSWKHKGLKLFFETGSLAGINPKHASKLRAQLRIIDTATRVEEINVMGFRLHPLKGDLKGQWSIDVNGNWRVTFAFEEGNASILDYQDYH